ncbi:hypothetical protein SDC9_56028 [bioreactor metagenome]|uniref:IPTL-CTERM protein sorting domain-containing protein n=1 Tax=bioreactor metagenome TaxID=1076179 RepID=A0A644X0N0_9ZZZZ
MRKTWRGWQPIAVAGCLCVAHGVSARELANVDALMDAPLASQDKRAAVTPESVRLIRRDARLGLPTFVSLDPQKQTTGSRIQLKQGQDAVGAARAEFSAVADLYGMTAQEVGAAVVQSRQPLPGGAKLVRFSNQRDGIDVFREQATVLLNAQSQALNIGGFLGSTRLAKTTKSASAVTLSGADAAAIALRDFDFPADVTVQLRDVDTPDASTPGGYRRLTLADGVKGARGGVLESAIRYRPVWFRMPEGLVHGYYLELRVREGSEHNAYSYVISSDDGRMLFRNSLTAHEGATPYTYGVWANPQTGAPYPGPQGLDGHPYPDTPPNGFALQLAPPSLLTLASAPFSMNDPWVDESVNTQLRFTYGNNVRAWADVVSPQGYDSAQLANFTRCRDGAQAVEADLYACTSSTAFSYGYDFSAGAKKNVAQASSSITNLFYVVNWLHDWFYDAGFDEASGNAQAVNYGRGGAENDPISARALNYLGFNNASMVTPSDGEQPVLRAHVYNSGSVTRSAALDNTIVVHEWAHYMTNRLIGNANGLSTKQAKALGEGWSDFIAQLVTVTEKDREKPGNDQYQGAYAHAAYASASQFHPAVDERNATYFGSRRYPFSTDLRKNPLTLRHMQDGEPLPADVPVNQSLVDAQRSQGFGNSQVHNSGEVWSNMLWECYASMLNTRPFAEAQQRMKNYLVAGLKLTPINPSLIDARDALLSVVAANDSQDYASCLAGFAKRGAGLGAVAPVSSSEDNRGVAESFNAGPLLAIEGLTLSLSDTQARRCDADEVLDNGETGVLIVNLVNRGNTHISAAQLSLSADSEFLSFPGGNVQPVAEDIAPGRATAVRVPVYLTGMATYGKAHIAVTAHIPDPQVAQQQVASSSLSTQLWLNADIQPQNATADYANVWPGGLTLTGRTWSIAGAADEHWYQSSVLKERGVSAIYTPELTASNTQDLVLTFDHQYDFGLDQTNGGQLVVAVDGKADVAVDVSYRDKIWWQRSGLVNTNPLRDQRAWVGRADGWQRDVVVNLGREYAGRKLRLGWRLGTSENGNPTDEQNWRIDNIRLAGIVNKPFASIEANAKTCTTLLPVSGAPQAATDGQTLAEPLRVQLADVSGRPIAREGVPVVFLTQAGQADIESAARVAAGEPVTVATDANGIAQLPVLMASMAGMAVGDQVLRVSPALDGGQPLIVPMQALAAAMADEAGASALGETATQLAAEVAGGLQQLPTAKVIGPTAIPTLSEWGLWMLCVLIGGIGVCRSRQRSRG